MGHLTLCDLAHGHLALAVRTVLVAHVVGPILTHDTHELLIDRPLADEESSSTVLLLDNVSEHWRDLFHQWICVPGNDPRIDHSGYDQQYTAEGECGDEAPV